MSEDKKLNIEEKKEKSPKKNLPLPFIFFGLSALITVLSVTLIILPKKENIALLKENIITEDANLKIMDRELIDLKNIILELQKKDSEEKDSLKKIILPTEFDYLQLIQTLDFLTHESKGYKLNNFTLSPLIQSTLNTNISEVNITLNIQATPKKIIDLVEDLESQEQIFLVHGLDIDMESYNEDKETDITLSLTTYYNIALPTT